MIEGPEIAIVGGGIGGGALATVLARHGLSVAVLERDRRAVDRVRGEYIAPWGVAEAARLDLLNILRGTGGVHVTRAIRYDETLAPKQAEASARDLRGVHPIGTGPLCAGHPAMCDALCTAASAAGASVLRGVKNIVVAVGEPLDQLRARWSVRCLAFTTDRRRRRAELHRSASARVSGSS